MTIQQHSLPARPRPVPLTEAAAAPPSNPIGGRLRAAVLPTISAGVLLLLWALLTSEALSFNPAVSSFSPVRALPALWELLGQQRTWVHVWSSLRRVFVGLGLATVIGVPLGVAVGYLPWLERATSGPTQFVRMISPLSWMPIAVMMLGIGDTPVYFLLAVAAVWPVLLNTADGVKHVERNWLEEARSLGASTRAIIWHVVAPAIVRNIVTGFRLGLGVAWIVLVPAEMLGVRAGLGYAILDARDRLAYPELMAVVLLIGLIGWTMDTLIRRVEGVGADP